MKYLSTIYPYLIVISWGGQLYFISWSKNVNWGAD